MDSRGVVMPLRGAILRRRVRPKKQGRRKTRLDVTTKPATITVDVERKAGRFSRTVHKRYTTDGKLVARYVKTTRPSLRRPANTVEKSRQFLVQKDGSVFREKRKTVPTRFGPETTRIRSVTRKKKEK